MTRGHWGCILEYLKSMGGIMRKEKIGEDVVDNDWLQIITNTTVVPPTVANPSPQTRLFVGVLKFSAFFFQSQSPATSTSNAETVNGECFSYPLPSGRRAMGIDLVIVWSRLANELPFGCCGVLQEKLNLVPRLPVLQRYLIGEGSHRRLSSSIRLSVQPESIAELHRHFCKIIIVEKLPSGVFADPFEIQHLIQCGEYVLFDAVLTEAAVFGDTNLELPSVVSNRSVVEVHMDVGYNTLSGKNNGLEINIEIPVHARYLPLGERGFSRVEFGSPDIFMHCNVEGKSHDHGCFTYADW
ncbi:hypothetical protein Acr_24g0016670 [Actinidia rufa]|uniref:Uncharacterized protein n=1 Tax=Actinidia rufa TaxID=165716 RepID=A0A7J0GXA9_9ERIC|nr:hypothetical protein Acr_24g0016670 [Actinidia rufa]